MTSAPQPAEIEPAGRPGTTTIVRSEAVPMWNVIVWDDPVNLMSYVVWVFRNLFGYGEERATKLMLDVHHRGRAIVASAPRERAEHDVARLHDHGLWATLEKG